VRLNAYSTVLLHPHEDRPVGVMLKGIRFLHEKLKTILRSLGSSEIPMNKLIAFWELACIEDGNEVIESAQKECQRQLGLRARKEIIEGAADIAAEELDLAIAA
jgi:hypothetical protein